MPKSTISDKLKEKHPKNIGGQTKLTSTEEERLVLAINTAAEWGFPLTEQDIRILVKRYLDKKGVQLKPFRDNKPGREWSKAFLSRHKTQPDFAKRYRAQALSQKILSTMTKQISVMIQEKSR